MYYWWACAVPAEVERTHLFQPLFKIYCAWCWRYTCKVCRIYWSHSWFAPGCDYLRGKWNPWFVLRIKIKAKGRKGAVRFQEWPSVHASPSSLLTKGRVHVLQRDPTACAGSPELSHSNPLAVALPFLRDSGSGWGSCTAAVPCPSFIFTERFLNGLQKPLGTQMSTYTCKMSLVNVFLLTLCFAPCLPEFPVTYLKYHSPKWKCASLFQTCKTHKNK